MITTLLTIEDIQELKTEILMEIQKLQNQKQKSNLKNYLKSSEVIKLLKVSPGTLQYLRDSGKLPFVKIRGNIFYEEEKIQEMMDQHSIGS